MKLFWACAAIATSLFAASAHADSIVYSGTMDVSGFGFGNDPRALTIQSHGPSQTTESGCIAPGGGGLSAGAGACAPGDGATGGSEANPISFPKQAAPSVSSLGVTNASQIGILFDGVQPQGGKDPNGTLTVDNLTLKIYDGTSLAYQVSLAPVPLTLVTNPGNGNSDYLFVLDPAAIASIDSLISANTAAALYLGLDSTISFPNQSAGPDSFTLVGLDTPAATPEPPSLAIVGTGMFAVAGLIWKRRRSLTACAG